MRSGAWLLLAVCCLGFLDGCRSAPTAREPVADPLLLAKNSTEGKSSKSSPPRLARAEPLPPRLPTVALASAPVPLWWVDGLQEHETSEPADRNR